MSTHLFLLMVSLPSLLQFETAESILMLAVDVSRFISLFIIM
jgi:hypothetical protein